MKKHSIRIYFACLACVACIISSCSKSSDSSDSTGQTGAISVPVPVNATDIIIAGKITPTTLVFKDEATSATAPTMQLDQYTVACTIYSPPVRHVSGTVNAEGNFALLLSESKDLPFSCYLLDQSNAYSGLLYYEDRSWVGLGDETRRLSQLRLTYNTYLGTVEYDPDKNIGRIDRIAMKGLTVYKDGSADILDVGGTEASIDEQGTKVDLSGTWTLWDLKETSNYPANIPASLQPAEDLSYYDKMAIDKIPNGGSLYYAGLTVRNKTSGYVLSGVQVWQDQTSFQTCGGNAGAPLIDYGFEFLDSTITDGKHLWTGTYTDTYDPFNGWRLQEAVDIEDSAHLPCSFYSGLDQFTCFARYYFSNYNGFSTHDNTRCLRRVHFDWTATDAASFVKTGNDLPKAVNEYIFEEIIYTDLNSGSLVGYTEDTYGFSVSGTTYTCTVQEITVSNFSITDTDGVADNEMIADLFYIRQLAPDSDTQCSDTSSDENRPLDLSNTRHLLYLKKQ